MKRLSIALAVVAAALLAVPTVTQAAFLLEIDTDGMDDAVLTYHPNFSYGGDTTTASQSAASNAVGLSGGDSIFGGNGGAIPDTYLYSYTPGTDSDNLALAAGTELNDDGDYASGSVVGGAGLYNVYGTWPWTNNVSGGDTKFELTDAAGGVLFSTILDQTAGGVGVGEGTGHEWVLLGSTVLDPSTTYTLAQTPTVSNSYVSQRAAAVMFDFPGEAPVPEPSAFMLTLLAMAPALRRRR